MPVDINAPNVVLKLQKIPTLGRGRRKQFYVILLQEVPKNASNLVCKLQMILTLGGGPEPLPDPPPDWSLHSFAVKASFCRFIVLHIFHPVPFCAPPPLPGLRPLTPLGLSPKTPLWETFSGDCMLEWGDWDFFGQPPPPPQTFFAHYATVVYSICIRYLPTWTPDFPSYSKHPPSRYL